MGVAHQAPPVLATPAALPDRSAAARLSPSCPGSGARGLGAARRALPGAPPPASRTALCAALPLLPPESRL